MKKLQKLMFVLVIMMTYLPNVSNAQINMFTEHQVVHMISNKIAESATPTGDYPYIGRLGLEYEHKNFIIGVGYVHRSNVDIAGKEYSYDGASLSFKLRTCMWYCN